MPISKNFLAITKFRIFITKWKKTLADMLFSTAFKFISKEYNSSPNMYSFPKNV